MSQDYLGEFEQMVLLSIMRLGDGAYGLAIRDELANVAERKPSSGALYTTLDRLERKGLLESHAGEITRERGGRPRRYVQVTPAVAQLRRSGRGRSRTVAVDKRGDEAAVHVSRNGGVIGSGREVGNAFVTIPKTFYLQTVFIKPSATVTMAVDHDHCDRLGHFS